MPHRENAYPLGGQFLGMSTHPRRSRDQARGLNRDLRHPPGRQENSLAYWSVGVR
jgi:hypothetical protein